MHVMKYLSRVFIAWSIFWNTVLFGGRNNQTISAGQWHRKKSGKFNFVWLIDIMFWVEPDHCQISWIKWTIINNAISHYDDIAQNYYVGLHPPRMHKRRRRK